MGRSTRVEVWMDASCPWCLLGEHRLAVAVDELASEGHDVEVVHRPFQLFPDAPAETEPLSESERSALGVHEQDEVDGYLGEVLPPGARWRPSWKPNTFDAHRLLAYAHASAGWRAQFRLAGEIMGAHFFHGEDVSRTDVLVAAAERAGVSSATDVLDSGAYTGQVRTGLTEGALSGVRAVPAFVVGGRALRGAQSVAALKEFLVSVPSDDSGADQLVRSFRLAQALLDANDPLGALDTLAPFVDEVGSESSVRLLTARAYYHSGQLSRACTTLKRHVEDEPTDDFAQFLLGRAHERRSEMAEALSRYRIAAALSPSGEYADAVRRTAARVSD